MRVFAVYSIKGGVGKTATAVNLADLAARSGARTILWDLDPQGAASFYFRIKPKLKGGVERLLFRKRSAERALRASDFENLDVIPADFSNRHLDLALDAKKKPHKRLRRVLQPLAAGTDVVILDCPPSISLATESVLYAADVVLAPTIPTPLSLRTHAQLSRHLTDFGRKAPLLLPFFGLVDRRKSLHREICERARLDHPEFLETWIPYSSIVEQMGVRRAPLSAFAPRSAACLAYAALWSEVASREDRG